MNITILSIFLSITITVNGRNVPKISRRIVNGATAYPHQFPYQATLIVHMPTNSGNKETARCGGTIISNKWILTAAHCYVRTEIMNPIKVIVGVNNLNDSNRVVADIERFIQHPNYTMTPNLANDIALIKLRKPLLLKKPKFSSIDLPTDGEETMLGEALTSGHGVVKRVINIFGFIDETSQDLFWLNVRILLDDECNVYNSGRFIYDPKTMVCTKAAAGKSVCNGDSGGPLVRKMANGNDILIGVTSFTHLSCRSDFPSVYTKVSAYRSWIRKETLI